MPIFTYKCNRQSAQSLIPLATAFLANNILKPALLKGNRAIKYHFIAHFKERSL
jgi:hypothetical protein